MKQFFENANPSGLGPSSSLHLACHCSALESADICCTVRYGSVSDETEMKALQTAILPKAAPFSTKVQSESYDSEI
jgi:hypothetical protein